MFLELPFGLTPSELKAIKAAYRAGCFVPGSCACRRPETPKLKEVAKRAGDTYTNFSHNLSNARRKILQAVGAEIFEEEV